MGVGWEVITQWHNKETCLVSTGDFWRCVVCLRTHFLASEGKMFLMSVFNRYKNKYMKKLFCMCLRWLFTLKYLRNKLVPSILIEELSMV